MNTYFATFITGTSQFVKEQLTGLKNISIVKMYDGLVIFYSSRPWRELQNIRYFNNLFLLLEEKGSHKSGKSAVEGLMNIVARRGIKRSTILHDITKGKRGFKIFVAVENETVSVNRSLLQRVERQIQKESRLRLNIKRPDLEFWFMSRREGVMLFGLRFTKVRKETKQRKKGELRAELAHIICLLSEPKPYDVVCDPFAGHGAIVIERAHQFPYKKICASDIDNFLVSELKKKIGKMKNIQVVQADALHLDLPDGSINKIITDPPWGEYRELPNFKNFYENMLREFNRILGPDGTMVILIGAKEIFESILQDRFAHTFKIKSKYNILVSGKKAAIYQLIRGYENNQGR